MRKILFIHTKKATFEKPSWFSFLFGWVGSPPALFRDICFTISLPFSHHVDMRVLDYISWWASGKQLFEKVVLISFLLTNRLRDQATLDTGSSLYSFVILHHDLLSVSNFSCLTFLWDREFKIKSLGLKVYKQHSKEIAFRCYAVVKSIIRPGI